MLKTVRDPGMTPPLDWAAAHIAAADINANFRSRGRDFQRAVVLRSLDTYRVAITRPHPLATEPTLARLFPAGRA